MASLLLSIHSIITRFCTSHTYGGVALAVYATPHDVCLIACADCSAAKTKSGLADVTSKDCGAWPNHLACAVEGEKLPSDSMTES